MRASLVDQAIDVGALVREVTDDSCGASVTFLGTVREVNDGRPVNGIEYSAYRAMAEREMMLILGEAAEKFGVTRLVIEHRLGSLGLGDVSVAVVVAHAHRAPALDANRYVIEELKRRVPIWKLEQYRDGAREWVGAGSGMAPSEPHPGSAQAAAESVGL
ncbi:MAG TPA: molybdenum cofactor biosynthesis protein MoaE [Gemmatimonadaceae bacterium]|nr:molybdenum cofactor biosynthesis protein MoaE [Gemmatimonadaceae bacterium]